MREKKNRLDSQMPEGDGTYSFCANCPSTRNCCTKVKPNGKIDTPILFPNDVQAIERFTGDRAESFSKPACDDNGSGRLIRPDPHCCYFYREGKCTIYPVRPLDCRLFPFDIIEKSDGRLVWIVYTALCPVDYDPHRYFEQAKKLLPQFGNNLRAYAEAETPSLDKEPFIELGDVELPTEGL